jgi:hypothetical protein
VYEKPEFPPLLPAGLHALSLADLEALCVDRFPLSATRRKIMTGLRQVVARITGSGISCALWIDGSFLTEKIDPLDVDLVALIPSRFYDNGTDEQRAVAEWLSGSDNQPKKLHHCDTHAEPMYPEGTPFHYMVPGAIEHWLRVYGRSVEAGEPKGIAVLELEGASQ